MADNPWVIRTDFRDDAKWAAVCDEVAAPVREFGEDFYAYLRFVDSQEYKDLDADQVIARINSTYRHTFVFIVDAVTLDAPEHPILVVDLYGDSARKFRAIPTQIQGIENNLSIANMDFEEFADSVDADGVFRGFPQP